MLTLFAALLLALHTTTVSALGTFNIRDAEAIGYEIETLTLEQTRSPLHADFLHAQFRGPGENLMITSAVGAPFACRLPYIPDLLDEHEPLSQLNLTERVKRAVRARCINHTQGWWTYRVCFGSNISQFHIPDGREEDPNLPASISLGKYATPTAEYAEISSRAGVVYEERFENGTLCDVTQTLREAKVTFHCREGGPLAIASVSETATCKYRILVTLDEMCNFKKVKTHPKITCIPTHALDAVVAERPPVVQQQQQQQQQQQHPPTEEVDPAHDPTTSSATPSVETDPATTATFVESSQQTEAGVAAELPPPPPPLFVSGETFVGNYTCQGEHSGELLVIRSGLFMEESQVAYHSVYGVFSFKNRASQGSYEVVGVFRNDTRRMTFKVGRWIQQPNRFFPLDIDGVLSTDKRSYHGVIPQCFASPFNMVHAGIKEEVPAQPAPKTDTCFGTICTRHCVTDKGPHSMLCLSELWALSGCAAKARRHPLRAPDDQIAYWSTHTVKDVLTDMTTYYKFAHTGRWPYPAYCLVPDYRFQSIRSDGLAVTEEEEEEIAAAASTAAGAAGAAAGADASVAGGAVPSESATQPPAAAVVGGSAKSATGTSGPALQSKPSEKLNKEWLKDLEDLNELLRLIVTKVFPKGIRSISNLDQKRVNQVFQKLNADVRGEYIMRANGLTWQDIDLEQLALYWMRDLEVIDYLYDCEDTPTASSHEVRAPDANTEKLIKVALAAIVANPRSDADFYVKEARDAQDRFRRIEHGYKEQQQPPS